MKHLLILSLLLFSSVAYSTSTTTAISPTEITDGFTAKVFKVEFNSPIGNQEKLSVLKNAHGITHYYSEGQYNTLLVIIAEQWLTIDGLNTALKNATDGQFQIIGEEIKTLDEAYLTK